MPDPDGPRPAFHLLIGQPGSRTHQHAVKPVGPGAAVGSNHHPNGHSGGSTPALSEQSLVRKLLGYIGTTWSGSTPSCRAARPRGQARSGLHVMRHIGDSHGKHEPALDYSDRYRPRQKPHHRDPRASADRSSRRAPDASPPDRSDQPGGSDLASRTAAAGITCGMPRA